MRQVSETIEDKPPVVEEKIENINESLPEDDPEELLSKIDTDEVTEEESIEESVKKMFLILKYLQMNKKIYLQNLRWIKT